MHVQGHVKEEKPEISIMLPSSPALFSVSPRSVDRSRTPDLALFQQTHAPPLWFVRCIHVSTGLDAESRSRPASREPAHRWNVDVFAGIELERWLGAEDLQVHPRLFMFERGQQLGLSGSGVERYGLGVGIDHEAAVDVGTLFIDQEWLRNPQRAV